MRTTLFTLLTLGLVAEDPAALRMRKDVTYLASPELKGRGHGSPGLEAAAAHLVAEYQKLGIQAVRQPFQAKGKRVRVKAEARFSGRDPLVFGRDLDLVRPTDLTLKEAPVVYVGAALVHGSRDDLKGLELKGKVAVMLAEPEGSTEVPASESTFSKRLRTLSNTGPAAILILAREGQDLPKELRMAFGPLPLLWVRPSALPNPLTQPGPLATPLSLDLKHEAPPVQIANVLATIPGTDPALKGEYIALGGHYDHVGETGTPLAIHPGADDNASGTALVLDLARALAQKPAKRSILLMHWAGEEEGLLGSAHWAKNPTLPTENVKFYFNFDMVGRVDPAKPKLDLGTLGVNPTWVARLEGAAPKGYTVNRELGYLLMASDHVSLATVKIPVADYFTGLHGDYHRPADTVDKLNFEGMARIREAVLGSIREMADGPETPTFDLESARMLFPMPTKLTKAVFGATPGEGEDPRGLVLGAPREGTPAADLGLQAGDILVSLNDQPIQSLFDLNAFVGTAKAGDKVKVQWLRGKEPKTATVELKAR